MVVPFDLAKFLDGFAGIDADDAVDGVKRWGSAAFEEGIVALEAVDHELIAVAFGEVADELEIAHVGNDWAINGHPDADEIGFSASNRLGVAIGLVAHFFGSGADFCAGDFGERDGRVTAEDVTDGLN